MATFDPELYLRLLGERLVVRDHRGVVGRRAEDLFEAASALVTCGVTNSDLAWRVIDAYTAALGIDPFRRPRPLEPLQRAPANANANAAADPRPLSARRVLVTDVEFDSRHGLGRLALQWIVLTQSRVTVRLRATVPSPRALTGTDPTIELTTPDGQQLRAICSAIIEPGLVGDFEARAVVNPDLDWLTIDGHRIELAPVAVPIDVTIEDRSSGDPAVGLIWQLLADFSDPRGEPSTGEPALNALRAAGAIPADDPQIPAIAWAKRYAPPAQRSSWTPQPVPAPSEPPVAVPDEWRGLARTRVLPFTGPSRTTAVATVTPRFDGIAVAVDLVRSGSASLTLEVEVAGLSVTERWTDLHRHPLAFWARDDQGNYYLGRRMGWTEETGAGPQAVGHGSVVFTALHPAATRLTVMAMTARACASIEIPL